MNKIRNLKISLTIIAIVVAIGIFILGFLVGHGQLKLEQGYKPKFINKELGKPKDVDFSLFWKVWNRLENDYLGKIDKQNLVYSAIKGLVAGTGDPYSGFMTPDETKEFLSEMEGNFSGIGAEVGMRGDKLTIVAPLSGSPAEKAGLRPGDIITEIDGIDASFYTIEEAVAKIRGKAGTEITLKITREGKFSNREFKITRQDISVESVNFEMKEEIAYIEITQFNEETTNLVKKYLLKAKPKGAKGLIVDVRNNPGGYLDTAIEVANLFVAKDKVIVSEEGRDSKKTEYKATEEPLNSLPLVLLINEGSASASEILAGAIKDYDLGTLIGEKTFGKGTVQEFEQFEDQSSLRLTVAKWLTPSGLNLAETGIEPDIVIELTDADLNKVHDPQLEKAIQELNKS